MLIKYIIGMGLCILSATLHAQEGVKLKDGKVWANDTVYCYYQENNDPVNDVPAGKQMGGEWVTTPFSDFIFGTASGDHLIRIAAKKLAVPNASFLIYYYNILFPSGKEINIKRRPYMIEYFAKDMVKYDVYHDGGWDDDQANVLYDKWSRKDGVLQPAILDKASVSNYNYHPLLGQHNDINVKEGKVFLYDSLVATYAATDAVVTHKYVAAKANGDKAAYVIRNNKGESVAVVFLTNELRAQAYMIVGAGEEKHTLTTADMSEENLVAAVARYLLWRKML